jgi:hypothetical protein
VPGRADRVEPVAVGPQPAGGEVQVPAGRLRVEQVQAALRGEPGTVPPHAAGRNRPDGLDERLVDGVACCHRP